MPFLPTQVPMIDQNGYTSRPWQGFFQDVLKALGLAAGKNIFTVTTQPTLGLSNAGYLGYETQFGHLLRWTGTAWEFMDGGNRYLLGFPAGPPQSVGWGLCDGSVYSYLVVGATLTTATYDTTPSIAANVWFRR